ncbi:glycosyl hydrolase family 28-related protein [Paenibacillus chartarius]|uniref:Glycosyl hydrolase family 28-related protein n=1 Tax=Paenibacillus chartarius TaxID=747481 RepID=A0ABV6DU55_9BACL
MGDSRVVSRRKFLAGIGAAAGIGIATKQLLFDQLESATAAESTVSETVYAASKPLALSSTFNINVKDYGAVGDGVTDDTPAIKRAFSALKDGDILYFPYGHYKTNASGFLAYILNKSVTILGNKSILEVADEGLNIQNSSKLHVDNLVVTRTTQSPYLGTASAFQIRNITDIFFTNNEISKFTDAIAINGTSVNINIENNKLHDLSQEPIVVRSNCNFVKISGNEIYRHLGDGILLKGVENIYISENYIHDPCKKDDASYSTFTGGAANPSIPIVGGGITCNNESGESGTVNLQIHNNTINGTGYGISLCGVQICHITHNRVKDIRSTSAIEFYNKTSVNSSSIPNLELVISQNHIINLMRDTLTSAIYVIAGTVHVDKALVTGNYVNTNSSIHVGINVTGNVQVIGNTVENYYRGIELGAGAIAIGNILIDGKSSDGGRALTLYDNAIAIGNKINSSQSSWIRGNNAIFKDNQINYNGNYWAVFIELGKSGNIIKDNVIQSSNGKTISGANPNFYDMNSVTDFFAADGGQRQHQISLSIPKGPTSSRPTGLSDGRYNGVQFLDLTIKKLIWWDASSYTWRDAMGNKV